MNYKQQAINSQTDLKIIKRTKNHIITKAKFGPSKKTFIPLNLTEELSFFTATIIGDGHLKKSKKQISIELSNKKLLQNIQKTCKNLFKRSFNIRAVKLRKAKKQSWHMNIDNKAIYNLLNQVFEVPIGKKTHIMHVPELIKKANKSVKSAFLEGIIATKSGKRQGRNRLGLSTASPQLWLDLTSLFQELGIKIRVDKWVYRKYKKEFYGLSFIKEDLVKLANRKLSFCDQI